MQPIKRKASIILEVYYVLHRRDLVDMTDGHGFWSGIYIIFVSWKFSATDKKYCIYICLSSFEDVVLLNI